MLISTFFSTYFSETVQGIDAIIFLTEIPLIMWYKFSMLGVVHSVQNFFENFLVNAQNLIYAIPIDF